MGYQISVTPLQMAAAVSSVANGGTLFEPRIVRAFIRNGRREPVPPKALRRTISPETAATLTAIMEEVVERGTAKAAQIEGYTIAGKTGTAREARQRRATRSPTTTRRSSASCRRASRRSRSIVVIDSPHGKVTAYGGTVAAPIFKRIAEASLRHLGIGPTLNAAAARPGGARRRQLDARASSGRSAERDARPAARAGADGLMPDLRGLSAREAVHSLTRIGLRARIDGDGFVIEQSPEAGRAARAAATARVLKLGRRAPVAPPGGAQQ